MLPCRAVLKPAGLYVALRDIPPPELRDAFMQQTVERMPAVDELIEIPEAQLATLPATSAPAGIVFHVGRCGSTLVSQLLKQLPGVTVYSEPLPFNDLLVPPQREPRARLIAALRVLGDLYARHANGPYVIKFSSWNTLYCDLLCEAFPATPWVLCLRDPLEVAVSLVQDRPGWLAAGSSAVRVFAAEVEASGSATMPAFEQLAAKLLAAFAKSAARLDARRGLVVDYPQLPAATWERIVPHFGLRADAAALARMAAASTGHAKAPLGNPVAFTPDGARKRSQATSALVQAIDEFARPAWVIPARR
jgi:hypothetical protein